MLRYFVSFAAIALLMIGSAGAAERLSDDEIAQRLMEQSIANYSGNCPCPDSVMRNGRRCGGRSAYSRPGGESPLCYRSDVTPQMIEEYRRRNRD